MIRPAPKTPSRRGSRTSPVSWLTRTSANWAAKACMAYRAASGLPGMFAVTSSPSGGDGSAVLGFQAVAQLACRLHDRRAPAADPRRKASRGSGRQRRVADLQPDLLDSGTHRIGGDLRPCGPGARADIGGRDRYRVAPAGFRPDRGG